MQNVVAAYAPLASPALTGNPTAPTQLTADNSTRIATTAYVQNVVAAYAPLASPALTGTPTAPTQTLSDNSTNIATTAFVKGQTWGYAALPTELANSIVSIFLDSLQDNHPIYMGVTQAMQVPANFAGTVSYSGTNASGTAVFNISYIRAGVPTAIGTITFTNASHTGTLSTQASVNLLVGDILVITQPHPLDALLAAVAINMVLIKQ